MIAVRYPPADLPAAPLVGREREQAILRERLDAALAGRGGLALLAGEAGIGKTALAEAICTEAERRGALVLIGRCYDLAETPPYGPWRDLFDRYHPAGTLPNPPAAFAQHGTLGAIASEAALVEQCAAFFRALAPARPAVLLLDDLHWADPASLDLLRTVARLAPALPLLIVATHRPDAAGHAPLARLLPTLVREAQPARLDLAPLAIEAIRALVAARYALPEADRYRLARYLAQRSEGNAFFLGELTRALEEQGGLVASAAGWRIVDLRAARVPSLVRQVIANRLAQFAAEARGALATAAVIGQEVPIDLWQRIAAVPEASLLALIEQAVAAQILIAGEDGLSVRFYHALTREALYEGMLPARRRALHRAIGEELAAQPAPPVDAVAHHFERAGDPRAVEWLIRSGELAQAACAYLTVAERYEAAMRLMGEQAATPEARGWLALRLAWLRFFHEPHESARRAEEAIRLAAEAGDAALAACACFSHGHFLVTSGDFAGGLREMRAGVAAFDDLPGGERTWDEARRRLDLPMLEPFRPRGVLAATLTYCGHFAEARDIGEAAVGVPREPIAGRSEYPMGEMQAWLGLGIAYAHLGEPGRSRQAFAACRAATEGSREFHMVSIIDLYDLTFPVLAFQTDAIAERRRLLAANAATWDQTPGTITDDSYNLFGGFHLYVLEGRWDEAREHAARGRIVPPVRFFQYATLGELARASGDTATAWRIVREVLPAGPATAVYDVGPNTALACQRLAAALALDVGDLPTARAWLAAHDAYLANCGSVPGRAEGQLGWANYFRRAGDLPRARACAVEAVALAAQPRQPLALLAAHRACGELATEVRQLAAAGEHLDAALALADACAAPYERALTLLALAELHLAAGDRERALASLGDARASLEPLAARPALARADALAAHLASAPDSRPVAAGPLPLGLSTREVEVLRLVAQGLTDAQVADRLFLARRTVSSHLTNIYGKLGVTSRTAAAHAAARLGLA